MKYVITDAGLLVNHNSKFLETVIEDVIVVVSDRSTVVRDKYRVIKCCIIQMGLGMDGERGKNSRRYRTIQANIEQLIAEFSEDEDILFLTDNNPESLYPLLAAKKFAQKYRFHLWAMTPLYFEGSRRIKVYEELMSDLGFLRSIILFDSGKMLGELDRRTTMPQFIKYMNNHFDKCFSYVCFQIKELRWCKNKKYFYSFETNQFIEVRDGFKAISERLRTLKTTSFDAGEDLFQVTASVMVQNIPCKKIEDKEYIEQLYPRLDGKNVCETLKNMRRELAKANGIEFKTVECSSTGPCAGTCESCDNEIRYLNEMMHKIPEFLRRYTNERDNGNNKTTDGN